MMKASLQVRRRPAASPLRLQHIGSILNQRKDDATPTPVISALAAFAHPVTTPQTTTTTRVDDHTAQERGSSAKRVSMTDVLVGYPLIMYSIMDQLLGAAGTRARACQLGFRFDPDESKVYPATSSTSVTQISHPATKTRSFTDGLTQVIRTSTACEVRHTHGRGEVFVLDELWKASLAALGRYNQTMVINADSKVHPLFLNVNMARTYPQTILAWGDQHVTDKSAARTATITAATEDFRWLDLYAVQADKMSQSSVSGIVTVSDAVVAEVLRPQPVKTSTTPASDSTVLTSANAPAQSNSQSIVKFAWEVFEDEQSTHKEHDTLDLPIVQAFSAATDAISIRVIAGTANPPIEATARSSTSSWMGAPSRLLHAMGAILVGSGSKSVSLKTTDAIDVVASFANESRHVSSSKLERETVTKRARAIVSTLQHAGWLKAFRALRDVWASGKDANGVRMTVVTDGQLLMIIQVKAILTLSYDQMVSFRSEHRALFADEGFVTLVRPWDNSIELHIRMRGNSSIIQRETKTA